MLIATLLLTAVPDTALRWIGVAAGLVIAGMGVYTLRRAGGHPEQAVPAATPDGSATGDIVTVALVGILSPAPWVFWTVVAGPLLLGAWNQGVGHAAGFLAAFYGCLVGSQLAVAVGVGRGRFELSPRWRARAMRVVGVALVSAGGVVAWQSFTGGYGEFVRDRLEVTRQVEETMD